MNAGDELLRCAFPGSCWIALLISAAVAVYKGLQSLTVTSRANNAYKYTQSMCKLLGDADAHALRLRLYVLHRIHRDVSPGVLYGWQVFAIGSRTHQPYRA